MQPIATSHVLINNTRIAYGIHGPRDGHPVVLLHGTPSSSLIWRAVIPPLTAAGCAVHAYDLLGYGRSERPADPTVDTSMSAQVPLLAALLDHWGLGRAHVVAHDIGGGVAQRFGVFHPQRVRSLVLVDAVSFDSYPSPRTRAQMAAGLEALAKREDAAHRAHFRAWLLSAVHKKDRLAAGSLDAFVEDISGPLGQPSLFQHQVRHYDPRHTMEVAGRLHELGGEGRPVKLIWGADDAWQVVDWAHRLHRAIPGSELEILEDCGHFAPEDQPEKIAELLIAFIKKHA